MGILRQVVKHFGIGLVTVLPFALVIWVLVTIFQVVDGLFGPWVDHWFGVDVPGVGFVLVLIGTTFVGALTRLYISHELLQMMDTLFRKTPFVKSLYVTFKELVQSLMGGRKRGFRRVVLVHWPDERAQVIGLVTNEEIPASMDPTGGRVAVYLPNTFQFSGITVLVDRSRIVPCELTVEEAFKFSLSGGLTTIRPSVDGTVDEAEDAPLQPMSARSSAEDVAHEPAATHAGQGGDAHTWLDQRV